MKHECKRIKLIKSILDYKREAVHQIKMHLVSPILFFDSISNESRKKWFNSLSYKSHFQLHIICYLLTKYNDVSFISITFLSFNLPLLISNPPPFVSFEFLFIFIIIPRCSECDETLSHERSCYLRNGRIFCREDYLKLIKESVKCSKCFRQISPTDWVCLHV